jgi:hypothetical protein
LHRVDQRNQLPSRSLVCRRLIAEEVKVRLPASLDAVQCVPVLDGVDDWCLLRCGTIFLG